MPVENAKSFDILYHYSKLLDFDGGVEAEIKLVTGAMVIFSLWLKLVDMGLATI